MRGLRCTAHRVGRHRPEPGTRNAPSGGSRCRRLEPLSTQEQRDIQSMDIMNRESPPPAAAAYEPPRVETVLTSEQLEREAHYAGTISILPG